MADRTIPSSTYRLQLHADFGFGDAAAVVPYLSRLGISHLYLSPILQAAPGSKHGYDVVDHSRVSADLGGESGLLALAETAHEHGLGIVVDVVPNHMAIPSPEHLNRQLWETLRDGPTAPAAHWFDVDWDRWGGRFGLPILGSSLEEMLAGDELTLDVVVLAGVQQQVLRYGDHCLPLAAGTDPSDLRKALAHQHYLLADWRTKDEVLNYRRFFDVDTLVAIRVELEDVFDATHEVLVDLHRRGVIDGFRIDHPDGLADPQGYLERLADKVPGAWIVVEKILEKDEVLPSFWPCAGTTGYDAIRAIQAAMVPAVADPLADRWQDAGGEPSLSRVELESKRLVLTALFQSELQRLVTAAVSAAADSGQDLSPAEASMALTELLAHVEVYRAYLRPGHPESAESHQRLEDLHGLAAEARPDLAAPLAVLHRLLGDTSTVSAAGQDLVVRFQQVCGPVMAKGIEDTTFYRWHRMIALNEVGGDPLTLESADPESLHGWAAQQQEAHPYGMTTLSTHDTKRNEDVRSRLLAAVENLTGWDAAWVAVRRAAESCGVDEPTAYLLMQTLVGGWPLDLERLSDYMRKAIREAKLHTTWNDPQEDYESRVLKLVSQCFTDPIDRTIAEGAAANAAGTRATTLATKLIQLTVPGVPDVYQGGELVTPSLVDPDNRRPVDYAHRVALLSSLDAVASVAGESTAPSALDEEKMWVTSRALRLRREHPELFDATAGYTPIRSAPPYLLGFLRSDRVATLVTRWPGQLADVGWGEAHVDLPPGTWHDILTDAHYEAGADGLRAETLFALLPVALLVKEES